MCFYLSGFNAELSCLRGASAPRFPAAIRRAGNAVPSAKSRTADSRCRPKKMRKKFFQGLTFIRNRIIISSDFDKKGRRMEKMILGQLAAFNQIYKEMDEIYHSYARRHGISDAALWLLYSLCEGGADTQGKSAPFGIIRRRRSIPS